MTDYKSDEMKLCELYDAHFTLTQLRIGSDSQRSKYCIKHAFGTQLSLKLITDDFFGYSGYLIDSIHFS